MNISKPACRCGRLAVLCAIITAVAPGADPALTIYNQNFAVVREILPVALKTGNNILSFAGVTAHVEPDSVILRDPTGRRVLQVLEQNYRNDPISQGRLLNLFEGKTIEFSVRYPDGTNHIVNGRIVRSGYVPHNQAMGQYGGQYVLRQMEMAQGGAGEPIVEVEGKLQFSLPGQPIFPALADDTILKPALDWILYSPQSAKFDAELSYVSGGMSWGADYNMVAPETGDTVDLVGWVTLDNQSGRQFDHARVNLMAGDVNKIQSGAAAGDVFASAAMAVPGQPRVEEKAFEDYHLWVITQESAAHRQVDSRTVEYDLTLQPDEEGTLTYTAHYTW